MRIYSNCYETASEIERDLKEMGKEVHLQTMQDKKIKGDPKYFTNELLCYSYMITNTKDKDELLKYFKGAENLEKAKFWAEAEFQERISGKNLNPGEAWKLREDVWDEFLHDGKFSYSYSERIGNQVEKIIEEFKIHPESRQGIISVWDSKIDIDKLGKERIPCSIFYQVIQRQGKLNLVYVIRSNDLYEHWCYDIWLAIRLQEYIAERLGFQIGNFYQFVISLHAYAYKQKGVF